MLCHHEREIEDVRCEKDARTENASLTFFWPYCTEEGHRLSAFGESLQYSVVTP
jgi:hypothetical protein